MNLIRKYTCCFNCDKGHMYRDTTEKSEYYKYVCNTCGSYSRGLLSGYFGNQYYNKDGSKVYDDNGRRINKHD